MFDPERSMLQTLVDIDETEMRFRSKHDPVDQKKGGRSPMGKIFIVGAVELSDWRHSATTCRFCIRDRSLPPNFDTSPLI